MSHPAIEALNHAFRQAAHAAGEAETSFRASFKPKLEALERERSFAFRRMNLVADMTRAALDAGEAVTAAAMALSLVAVEFHLEAGREAHARVLDELRPVAEAVAALVFPAPEAEAGPDVAAALARFEAWYQGEFASPFLARADLPAITTPLTDW